MIDFHLEEHWSQILWVPALQKLGTPEKPHERRLIMHWSFEDHG
jgi:hypothetical protein